jgi:hypothetical protein
MVPSGASRFEKGVDVVPIVGNARIYVGLAVGLGVLVTTFTTSVNCNSGSTSVAVSNPS